MAIRVLLLLLNLLARLQCDAWKAASSPASSSAGASEVREHPGASRDCEIAAE